MLSLLQSVKGCLFKIAFDMVFYHLRKNIKYNLLLIVRCIKYLYARHNKFQSALFSLTLLTQLKIDV